MTNRTIIKANQSWFHIPWHEIWEYRDLLWNLMRRDLTAIYKQSILGPLWFIIVPLATTIVFTVIFGSVAKVSTDGLPPFLFYMTSMVLWNYFQGCMNGVSNSLIINAQFWSRSSRRSRTLSGGRRSGTQMTECLMSLTQRLGKRGYFAKVSEHY